MKKAFLIIMASIFLSTFLYANNTKVVIETNEGNIEIELYDSKAPATVKNFLRYVDNQKYNGTIFHRVIGNFMIQGGGYTPGMRPKSTYGPIKNEAYNRLSNERGTIAMARTNSINSATNQFFINVRNNYALDFKDQSQQGFGYCVFGKVIDGMNVVDKIRNVRTGRKGYFSDVPVKAVIIISIRRKR